jgi:hypothetical protein
MYHRERIWKSSTLSCMKKRRKSPNLPQDEGAPPLLWGALSRWGRALGYNEFKDWAVQTQGWWNRRPYCLKIIIIHFFKKYLCAQNEFSPWNKKSCCQCNNDIPILLCSWLNNHKLYTNLFLSLFKGGGEEDYNIYGI